MLGGRDHRPHTALLLKRDGARVAVVEATRVGRGVTGCTTAKFTAAADGLQHAAHSPRRRRRRRLRRGQRGGRRARRGAGRQGGNDCDLERRPTFTTRPPRASARPSSASTRGRARPDCRSRSSTTPSCRTASTAWSASTTRSSSPRPLRAGTGRGRPRRRLRGARADARHPGFSGECIPGMGGS